MTNDEIKRRLQNFDDGIKDAEGVPTVQKQLQAAKDKFLKENPIILPSLKARESLKRLVTEDSRMIALKEQATILACTMVNDPVLIIGETGTGKELIAQALHGDRSGSLIDINCAGLPEYLIESELFGHKRGAFTGADLDKQGLFEIAQDGTIFLDEIGELPLNLQAKLLRVLQERRYRRVGDTVFRQTNARVVSATHHDLSKLAGESKFRADLLARINTFVLITIPLRERIGDIKLIVDSLDKNCYAALIEKEFDWTGGEHKWPLNVRDIQRVVRQWQVLGKVL